MNSKNCLGYTLITCAHNIFTIYDKGSKKYLTKVTLRYRNDKIMSTIDYEKRCKLKT